MFCFVNLATLPCASAQSSTPEGNRKVSSERAVYEDKLIDAGNLAPIVADEEDASFNPEGWSRAWRIEAFTSHFDQGGVVTRENGLAFNGRLETPNYGAFTLDSEMRSNARSSIFTLWQRGMPFDNGWRANNVVGMLNTMGIDLSRSQYRFFLPSFPIAGAQTEWLRDKDIQLQASVGEPGLYNGLRVSGFTRLNGSVTTLGAQKAVTPQLQAGFQFADAQGVESGLDPNNINLFSSVVPCEFAAN